MKNPDDAINMRPRYGPSDCPLAHPPEVEVFVYVSESFSEKEEKGYNIDILMKSPWEMEGMVAEQTGSHQPRTGHRVQTGRKNGLSHPVEIG